MQSYLAHQIEEQSLSTALVIDDAFDMPRSRDVADSGEEFLDLLSDDDLKVVGEILDQDGLDKDQFLDLIEDDNTARALYDAREKLPKDAAAALFAEFEDDNHRKRAQVRHITELLSDVGFQVTEQGSTPSDETIRADLVFVDLFFSVGLTPEEAAADAARKIETYLPPRESLEADVPLVILVSTEEQEVEQVFEQFREAAGLPGCRFTFLKKSVFEKNRNEAIFRILKLVRTNRESQIFETVVRKIESAASLATRRFVRKLRQFELSDYADLSTLVAEPDGVSLSQYLLELYALAWASFAESDDGTVEALTTLGSLNLNVENYPPNAFVPSPAVLDLYESALYRPGKALESLADFDGLGLGDVLVGPKVEGNDPTVFLVVVQDCDMARGDRVDAAFLLPGNLKKLEEARAMRDRFPITIDGEQYSVSWKIKGWRALRRSEFPDDVAGAGYVRAMRLRSPWATMRQLEFFRHLSRPAAIAAPHQIDATYIEILLQNTSGRATRVRDFGDRPAAYLLHAGTPREPITRLILSEGCAAELRELLDDASKDEENYGEEMRGWLTQLLGDAERLSALSSHLFVENDKKTVQADIDELISVAWGEKKPFQDGATSNGLRIMLNAKSIDASEFSDQDT